MATETRCHGPADDDRHLETRVGAGSGPGADHGAPQEGPTGRSPTMLMRSITRRWGQ
jgi:hypothetical protein